MYIIKLCKICGFCCIIDGDVIAEEVGFVLPHGTRRATPAGLFGNDEGAPVVFHTSFPSKKRMRAALDVLQSGMCSSQSGSGATSGSFDSNPSSGESLKTTHSASVTSSDCLYGPKGGPGHKAPSSSGYSLSSIPGRPMGTGYQGPNDELMVGLPPSEEEKNPAEVEVPLVQSASSSSTGPGFLSDFH